MGYMTVVSILNDAWDLIKKNPQQFIENIEEGMHGYTVSPVTKQRQYSRINTYPIGYHCNPMEVCKSFHADDYQVFLVGGNSLNSLVEFNLDMPKNKLEYLIESQMRAEEMIGYSKKYIIKKIEEEILASLKETYPSMTKEEVAADSFKNELTSFIKQNEYVKQYPKYFSIASMRKNIIEKY